jgi:hypothetical protein
MLEKHSSVEAPFLSNYFKFGKPEMEREDRLVGNNHASRRDSTSLELPPIVKCPREERFCKLPPIQPAMTVSQA